MTHHDPEHPATSGDESVAPPSERVRPPAAPWEDADVDAQTPEGSRVVATAGPIGDITPAAPGADGADPPEPLPPLKKKGSFFRELPILILIAFGLAMLIKTFFIQAFFIPSESMVPTLVRQDRVLVNKIVYRIRDPRRGEIIVFVGEREERQRSFLQRVRDVITEGLGSPSDAEKDFIKRVIALPGETIEMTAQGAVFITDTEGERFQLVEPYLAERDPTEDATFGPFTVPPDSYFVMGDNRDNSADSRTVLGPIPKGDIVGKAFVRIWPLGRFGFFRTPSYDTATAAAGLGVAVLSGAALVRRRRL